MGRFEICDGPQLRFAMCFHRDDDNEETISQCNMAFKIYDAEQRIRKKNSLDIIRTLWYCVVSRKGADKLGSEEIVDKRKSL